MPQALIMLTEPSGEERPLAIGPQPVNLGRDPGNEIVVTDGLVSRRHLRLRLSGTRVILEDLDSSGGTFLNGYRITQGELGLGGEVIVGRTRLRFVSTSEEAVIAPQAQRISHQPAPEALQPSSLDPRSASPPGTPGSRQPAPVLGPPGHSPTVASRRGPSPQPVAPVPGVRSAIACSDFRHPWEIPAFLGISVLLLGVFTVAFIFWVISLFVTLGAGLIWIPIVGLWWLGLVISVIYQYYSVRSRYPQVSERVYPQVYAAATSAARRLNMNAPPVFVATDESEINAWATSVFRPLVVVNQGLLDALDPAGVQFVLGHEFSHIRLWHTPLSMWLHNEMMDSLMGQFLWLPCLLLRLLFFAWDRLAEHSADRGGMLACGSLSSSVLALLALRHGGRVNPADLQREVDALRAQGRSADDWEALTSTHPSVARRVNDLVAYRGAPQGQGAAGKLRMSPQSIIR